MSQGDSVYRGAEPAPLASAVDSAVESAMELADGDARPVLVLTRHPEDYAEDMLAAGLTPLFAAGMPELMGLLRKHAVSGFVLEVDQVLHTRGLEREHLYLLAEAFPLLRVRRPRSARAMALLDDPERFADKVRRFFPRRARLMPRVPVLFDAVLTGPDDPGFAEALPATVLDVSATGGLLMGKGPLPAGNMWRVRIPGLFDQTPITAGV
ncbi:MAG: hypothetical protein AUJ49_02925, partial [Desulfovibrionaceae bacterium CG1_02_65_16]